jgi:hypothetical protein
MEILCITKHDERMVNTITMGGLDNVQVSTFSCTPEYGVELSLDLLDWIRITIEGKFPFSFTNFITTPDSDVKKISISSSGLLTADGPIRHDEHQQPSIFIPHWVTSPHAKLR